MNAQTKINYPETKKIDHVDTYFGEQINDVYRWLEDDRSPETEAWVKAQNVVTYNYLEQIPYRRSVKKKNGTTLELRENFGSFQRRRFHVLLQK